MNSTLPPALTAHQPVVCQGPSTRRLASPSAALPRTLPRSRLGSIATRAALLLGAVLLLPAGAGAAAGDAVAAGKAFTCAITSAGGLKCWGANSNGQLGNGTTTGSVTPAAVVGLNSGVAAVSAGDSHSCALTSAGGAKCWGYNGFGGLGDGTVFDSPIPVNVIGLPSGVAAVSAALYHSCALTSAGGAKCWGHNGFGELGNGSLDGYFAYPVEVSGF